MSKHVRRWLDSEGGTPEHVRSVLGAARRFDAATRTQTWAKIAAATGAPLSSPPSPPAHVDPPAPPEFPAAPSLTSSSASATVKLALVAVLAGLAANPHRTAPARPRAPTSSAVAPAVRPAASAGARSGTPAVTPRPTAPASRPVAPPVVPLPSAPRIAQPMEPAPTHARMARRAVPVPPHALPVAPPTVTASAPGGGYAAPSPSLSASDVEAETALITQARSLLGSDPGGALALAESHARTYPLGILGHEREAVAVRALLRLGRAADALARAERFLRSHPTSTIAPHIRVLRTEAERASSIP